VDWICGGVVGIRIVYYCYYYSYKHCIYHATQACTTAIDSLPRDSSSGTSDLEAFARSLADLFLAHKTIHGRPSHCPSVLSFLRLWSFMRVIHHVAL